MLRGKVHFWSENSSTNRRNAALCPFSGVRFHAAYAALTTFQHYLGQDFHKTERICPLSPGLPGGPNQENRSRKVKP